MTEPTQKTSVTATRSISFRYASSEELALLFEDFRSMCNDAIRIAVQENPKNRFRLIELAYPRLKEYGLHTHYVLSACEVAYSLYKNKNRKSIPYVKRAFLKLDNQSYHLNRLLLRIPTTPRNFVYLTLQGSVYHASFADDPTLRRGSVTINNRTVSIAFTKEVEMFEHTGVIGIDINERNATVSATDGWHHQFTELGEVVEIKQKYKEIRAKIGKVTRQDKRIGKRLLAKYGRRERNRTTRWIHGVTTRIVNCAVANKFGIKMERLNGIRKLYRKGNGQGPSFRGRMNSWVFGETQRQIEYKAKWVGIPCWYVNPRGTSRNCPECGSRVAPIAGRKLYCPKCDKTWDRDDLASKNLMACVVPQARPSMGSCEGERGGDGSNPPSRWRKGRVRG